MESHSTESFYRLLLAIVKPHRKSEEIPLKTLLRILISLLIVAWLGAVMFFPAVAAIAFHVLPDATAAAAVVRGCLLTLHSEGLFAGSLLLILLVAAAAFHVYGRTLIGPILCTVAMLLLTAFSQRNIIPRMDADRLSVGGDINAVSKTDPRRAEFDRLHTASEELEEGVLVAGLALVVLLARPPLTGAGIAAGRRGEGNDKTLTGNRPQDSVSSSVPSHS